MKFTCIKTTLIAAAAMLSLNSFSQDLLALQAPIDKKLKSVDSLALHKQILAEQAAYPAFDLYPTWSNVSVHNYAGVKLPESYTVDLTNFCIPTTNTRITSKFGPRRRRMHNGIDVAVRVGDTIRAAFDGKVRVVRFERKGYGQYVVIRHNNGLETVYGHLSKQLVTEETYVKAGDIIGLGGNTGRSSGPHLHFETRFLGVAINPALIIDFAKQDIVSDHYTFRNYRSTRGGANSTMVADGGDGVIRYHKVKSGDTLSKISRQQGISISALCKLNHITQKTILRPGQVLRCS